MSLATVCAWSRIASKQTLSAGGEELRQELLERLIDCRLMGATSQILCRDPERLPLRELPHGCWSNVYLLYVSYCKAAGETPASKSTFFTVSESWRKCLRFHKQSQHQVCLTCSKLKTKIRQSKDWTWLKCFNFAFAGSTRTCTSL